MRGIDFEVGTGEVFGLLGANGAGKTTTIEILEGYRTRSARRCQGARASTRQRPTRAWRDRIGLVLQEGGLSPLLTVREVLTMYAELFSRPREPRSTHRAGRPRAERAMCAWRGSPAGSAGGSRSRSR